MRYAPRKSLWFLGMLGGTVIGGTLTFSPAAFSLFVVSTTIVLLFGHSLGSYEVRGAAVQGHNVRWTSLLTMGECWHNNHHAFPGSARLWLHASEWDPGWWMLMLFRRLGLAWNFRLPADLEARPELVTLEAWLTNMHRWPQYADRCACIPRVLLS